MSEAKSSESKEGTFMLVVLYRTAKKGKIRFSRAEYCTGTIFPVKTCLGFCF